MDLEALFDQIYKEAQSDEKKYLIEQARHKLIEAEVLWEMATVCRVSDGFGFQIRIWSDDHDPAHLHIVDPTGEEITRILLTDIRPKKPEDVIIHPGDDPISHSEKKKIIQWANKRESGMYNWTKAKTVWKTRL